MGFILYLIMGGIIGWLAGMILGKDIPGGIIGNIIAGIVGAWLGGMLLGQWGPEIWSVYIVPALIGALVLVFVLSLILGSMRKGRNRS
ncbi:MAG TPA: GlsB/YeaQ/YmgE family stress response membrane protein [Planococcus sp. (in: firmicutes)]|nr:GlsB/YeaQ/YmgE family stress response membrane protein [Planococcus sp. (in: firmicutes)]